MHESSDTTPDEQAASRVGRRSLLVTAGKSAAVGAALAAGGVTLQGAASANPDSASSDGSVAAGPKGTTAFEFAGRIDQDGGDFVGYGFLTEVVGLSDSDLFADAAHLTEHSEASARLTVAGDVVLQSRTIRGSNVFVLDAVGDLLVYLQDTPGADFGDPASFRQGQVLARYSMQLQDVLTVIAPNEGIPTLYGSLVQTEAGSFTVDGEPRRFGRQNARLRLDGTGHGVRTSPEPPVAHIDLAARVTVDG